MNEKPRATLELSAATNGMSTRMHGPQSEPVRVSAHHSKVLDASEGLSNGANEVLPKMNSVGKEQSQIYRLVLHKLKGKPIRLETVRNPSKPELTTPSLGKRGPECMRRCIMQGLLHPVQCHSLC